MAGVGGEGLAAHSRHVKLGEDADCNGKVAGVWEQSKDPAAKMHSFIDFPNNVSLITNCKLYVQSIADAVTKQTSLGCHGVGKTASPLMSGASG